jgi:hypothetical protein
MIRRGLRLKLVAGLGIALAMPALAVVEAHALGAPTTTVLALGTQTGCTQALTVTVTSNGLPVTTGSVIIEDDLNGNEVQLATVALVQGAASPTVSLTAGSHLLTAVYAANGSYLGSISSTMTTPNITSPCEFTVTASPGTVSLTPGQTGTVAVSVASYLDFTSTLSAPLFVTLSCSGLPDQSSCAITPENVEILPNANTPLTSSMVLITQAASSASVTHPHTNSVAWALLLPGALGLGGLAWGVRRRAWLSRISLLALVGLVATMGTTACNPRYDYEHHGPPINPATPAGTYTVIVTAQSSNGITAVTNSTSLVLTVQ